MASLAGGCLDRSAGSDYLLGVMGRVVPSQRWGLSSAGVGARFKGGWGPGQDGRYLVRQMGVVDSTSGGLAVAAAVVPSDGTLASGTAMLDRVSAWVVEHAGGLSGSSHGC